MRLAATLDEHLTAKQRSRKAWEQRRFAAGLCIRCGKAREADRQVVSHCWACSKGMNDQRNRSRYGRPLRRKGPQPRAQAWNFATDDLIIENIRLARRMAWLAWRRLHGVMDVDDVLGEAMYGLTKAGRTFDATRGVPFEAWAVQTVRTAIWHGVKRWTYGYQQQPPMFVPLDWREGVA